MGRLLDIARAALADETERRDTDRTDTEPSTLVRSVNSNAKRNIEKPEDSLHSGGRVQPDPYHARVQAALSKINRLYPAGMALWLEDAHKELYEELISRIPIEIDQLWNESAPLDQFQAALDRWVTLHREGCLLYREYQAVSALTGAYLAEQGAATEDAHPSQNSAFKDLPTPARCEISEKNADMEDPVAMRSDPEEP
jgi:hypothetical protein